MLYRVRHVLSTFTFNIEFFLNALSDVRTAFRLPDLCGPPITVGFPDGKGNFLVTLSKKTASSGFEICHHLFHRPIEPAVMRKLQETSSCVREAMSVVVLPPLLANTDEDEEYGRLCASFIQS
jgi:hypothetical protein